VQQLADRGIGSAIEANGIDALGPDLPPLLREGQVAFIDELQVQPSKTPRPPRRPSGRTADAKHAYRRDTDPLRSVGLSCPRGCDRPWLGRLRFRDHRRGSIHLRHLRGRAFAGATGNAKARIFCRKNEAELLAVDGWYRTADDMEPSSRGRPIQAFLDNGVIWVAALD
jgi:septum site-determining protein MinC